MSRRTLRVLLANDDGGPGLPRTVLEQHGHSVTVAGSGSEAVEAIGRDRFDVVLMDLRSPGMDGLRTCVTIRTRERGSGGRVPIIALVTHAMSGDRQRCVEAGVDGCLSNPLDTPALLDTLARMASRRVG